MFLLIGFSCLFSSCSEKQVADKIVYSATLEPKEDLILPLDDYSPHDVFCLQLFSAGEENFLFVLNHLVNRIYMYSYPAGQVVRIIDIPREGPNGLSRANGFFVHNLDSIFVFPRGNLYQTRLVDYQGNFSPLDMSGARWNDLGLINAVSITTAPTVYEDGVFYFVQYPVGFEMPDDRSCTYPYLGGYALAADSLFSFPVYRYPEKLCDRKWPFWGLMCTRVIKNGRQVINWPWSDELLILQADGQLVKKEAITDAGEIELPPFRSEQKEEEEVAYMLNTVTYQSLYFDPVARVYYRLAHLPVQYDPEKHINYQAFDDQPLAVVILDEAFEKIGEKRLPASTYSSYTGFAYDGAFCLSRANHYNSDLEEESLPFGCFSLVYEKDK